MSGLLASASVAVPAWIAWRMWRVDEGATLGAERLETLAVLGMLWTLPVVACWLPLRWPRLIGIAAGVVMVPWVALGLEGEIGPWALLAAALMPLAGHGLAHWPSWRLGIALMGLAGVLGALWYPGSAPVGEQATSTVRGPVVVLITLDTVRADQLAAIGGSRFDAPTPHLDALAARGTLFTQGVAPAPLTGPSHAGMLTAQSPIELGVLRNGHALPDVVTVAEELSALGWRTGAFVGAAVLDRRVGLHRGFQHYDDRFDLWHRLQGTWPMVAITAHRGVQPRRQRPGAEVVSRALAWLDPSVASLLWVHLYDAHHPYDPPPNYVDSLVDRDPGRLGSEADVRAGKEWGEAHMQTRSLPGFDRARDVSSSIRDYAAEVAELDGIVGTLLEGLPKDAWILVAADHGESLTEHGYVMNHGRHAFQATLRVPMIAVGPGFGTAVVQTPAPSWLVGGTLRQWAGLEGEGLRDAVAGWDRPIESYAAGQEARSTFRLGSAGPELAVREGHRKRMVARGRQWLFDLDVDPGELNPENSENDALMERLEAIRTGHTDPTPEWLEALGYTE